MKDYQFLLIMSLLFWIAAVQLNKAATKPKGILAILSVLCFGGSVVHYMLGLFGG